MGSNDGRQRAAGRAQIGVATFMSSSEIVSIEPATGAVLWRGMPGDPAVEVATARAAWSGWAARPLAVRMETLRRYANTLRSRADALADLIARETGKPLWDARDEVDATIAQVEGAIAAYSERTAQRRYEGALGAKNAVRHKPHGVLAVIGPFNQPAQIPSAHIVPALLAGNGVVFKPSEKTPATGCFLVDCLRQAGVPDAVVRVVPGGPDVGRALAADGGIDGLLFTGSTATGLALHRSFADMPNRLLALEMGGNNPLVVWDTPDVHSAAVIAVQSAFSGAGQRCTAARRLIVRDGAHEPLIEAIGRLIDRIIIDAPHASPAPFMGPLIDNAAADHVQERFLDLLLKGGRAIKQMARPKPDLPFVSAALIDVTTLPNRADEEIFGPVLQIIRVPDFAAAIAEANNSRHGLVAALICGDPALYTQFWAGVRAGAIHWNRPTTVTAANAPSGGIGLSGNHRPGGAYLADHCAYPVLSAEAEQLRAGIGIGLTDG